jgi:hypothetical protein
LSHVQIVSRDLPTHCRSTDLRLTLQFPKCFLRFEFDELVPQIFRLFAASDRPLLSQLLPMPIRALLRLRGQALGDALVLALENLAGAYAELGLIVVGPRWARDTLQVGAPYVVFAGLIGALVGRAEAIVALRNAAPLLALALSGFEK